MKTFIHTSTMASRPNFACRCLHLSSVAKFLLFLSFTVTYCYISYKNLPNTKPTRSTTNYHGNYSRIKHVQHIQKLEPEYDWSEVERELAERRETVHEVCYNSPKPKPKPNAWEFVIDARHSLIWCNVFKSASSSWMHNFNVLGGYGENFLRISHTNPITLMRSQFPRPTIHQLLSSLPTSLSFLIVRDPFHRLLSAYRNKIERLHTHYYRRLANTIVIRYRTKPPKPISVGPTFEEFARYVAETHSNADEHWAPIYKFCTPCAVNFTVIAKLETLPRDQAYIIHKAKLGTILTPERISLQNKANDGTKTKSLVQRYYSKLNKPLIDKLISLYTMDFEMFGYNSSQYYDIINK